MKFCTLRGIGVFVFGVLGSGFACSGAMAEDVFFEITSTADSGPGTFRAAIESANADNSDNTIVIETNGTSFQRIELTSPLPTLTRDNTSIDGGKLTLNGVAVGGDANGLTVAGQNVAVTKLIFEQFSGNGLEILGDNCQVHSCSFGTETNGGARKNGILVNGAKGTTIGADFAGAECLFLGNVGNGIEITGDDATDTLIQNCGFSIFPDNIGLLRNGGSGIFINNAGGVTIHDCTISGNEAHGIQILGLFGNLQARDITITGNRIGVDYLGQYRPNFHNNLNGISASNVDGLLAIGSTETGGGNIITANGRDGIFLQNVTPGPGGEPVIVNNTIGTDVTGTNPAGNGRNGITAIGQGIRIGGPGMNEGNLIGNHLGQGEAGILISTATTNTVTVQGNVIGESADGSVTLPNENGILIANAHDNRIGGLGLGEGNRMVQNLTHIRITGAAAGNTMRGNVLASPILNQVEIEPGAQDNIQPPVAYPVAVDVFSKPTAVAGFAEPNATVDIHAVTGEFELIETVTAGAGGGFTSTVDLSAFPFSQSYTAAATNANGSTSDFANSAKTVSGIVGVTRTVTPAEYSADDTVDVTLSWETFGFGTLTSLIFLEVFPDNDWDYAGPVDFMSGISEDWFVSEYINGVTTLTIARQGTPAKTGSITYRVSIGAAASGDGPVQFSGFADYSDGGNTKSTPMVFTEVPESFASMCAPGETHTADQNRDKMIDLGELLRVVQLFNTGSYGCDVSSEDGYAPGSVDQSCCLHESDYGANWLIDYRELLRLIQFYNSNGYAACPLGGTEDGFCPTAP